MTMSYSPTVKLCSTVTPRLRGGELPPAEAGGGGADVKPAEGQGRAGGARNKAERRDRCRQQRSHGVLRNAGRAYCLIRLRMSLTSQPVRLARACASRSCRSARDLK